MKLTEEEIEKWVKFYKKHKKFPSLKIPCVKCENTVTLSYSNLTDRIEKFNGAVNLLKQFQCRKCLYSVRNETKLKIKKIKKAKKAKKEEILSKTYIYIPKEKEIIDLVQNPEYTAKLTATECWRPDIFLNNDRSCNSCSLKDICTCSIKSLKNEKRREGTSISRRK